GRRRTPRPPRGNGRRRRDRRPPRAHGWPAPP
ncbi:MAG: hypothetical protein AVDCRST_MAG54-1404, partial [uncultured Actinomycetospora sp.]